MSSRGSFTTKLEGISPHSSDSLPNESDIPRKKAEDAAFVIFGATGDLTRRKLIPALFKLFAKKLISDSVIIAVGRRPLSTGDFLDFLDIDSLASSSEKNALKEFSSRIHYFQLDFGASDFSSLSSFVEEKSRLHNCPPNRVFYLAMPPQMFKKSADIIKSSGLLSSHGWKRVVFEKPFGSDLASAKQLNAYISSVFREDDIYRIDHYLGKELVQNILVFRFANSVFEQIWNNRFIDHVQITFSEKAGIGGRAGYYEHAGAIRDMLQNHAMQVLSLVAMDSPVSISADDVRNAKVAVLKSLITPSSEDVVIAQYSSGLIDGEAVKAYRDEDGVSPSSNVETFAAVKIGIDNKRWKGVPFFIRTGKRLKERYAEVNLVLKDVACNLFCSDNVVESPNIITIRIQPDEGIAITFNVKYPGPGIRIYPVLMDFCHTCLFSLNTPEAYETLLHEILAGDQTLFTRWDEVEESWKFIDRVIDVSASQRNSIPLYPAGSFGPPAADNLLERSGRKWLARGKSPYA